MKTAMRQLQLMARATHRLPALRLSNANLAGLEGGAQV